MLGACTPQGLRRARRDGLGLRGGGAGADRGALRVERDLHGKPPDACTRERQTRSKPLAEALKAFAETSLAQVPGRSDMAKTLRYMLARWPALMRAFDDGRLALDNNAAERALLETAKLNGLDPEGDVLRRISDHPAKRLADLLPWTWMPTGGPQQAA